MRLIASLVVLFVLAGGALADVTVAGEGKVSVSPDVVHISVGVETVDKSAVNALRTNSKTVKALFAVLKEAGVDKKDMQTRHFSVSQLYEYNDKREMLLQGYQVVNNLAVCVRKLDTVGDVLDKLVKNGANKVGGVTYGLSDPSKALDDARVAAINDARRRAELYTKTADVVLGRPITITESVETHAPIRLYADSALTRESVPLATGSLTYTVRVTVVYATR